MTSPEVARLSRLINSGGIAPKRSKYGNKPTFVGGLRFDSAKEARRGGARRRVGRSGEISDLKRQARYPIELNGQHWSTYVADFAYRENGELVLEDVKGGAATITDVFKLKVKALRLTQGIEVRIV